VAARLQLALAAVLGMVALALGGVLLLGGDGKAEPAHPGGFEGYQRPPIPARVGEFHLRDQDGRAADLREYRGKVVVLTFLYSTCQDTCPVTAQQIRGAMDRLGHDVPALAVSVDPANDDPQNAKAFLAKQTLTGRMRFLLGTRAQLAPVWKAYGIQPQGKGFEHSAYVLLIDKRGRQRISFPTSDLTPEALAHDIRRLQAEPA
jgi:protein SCO1/2